MSNHDGSYNIGLILVKVEEYDFFKHIQQQDILFLIHQLVAIGDWYDCNHDEMLGAIGPSVGICYYCLQLKQNIKEHEDLSYNTCTQCTALMHLQDSETSSTPLYLAVKDSNLDKIQSLIDNGVDVNIIDPYAEETALNLAVQNRNLDITTLLINNGADVNIYIHDSCVHSAVQNSDNTILTLLIEKGANVNALTRDGQTPLYIASSSKYIDTVNILSSHGAINFNAQDALIKDEDWQKFAIPTFNIDENHCSYMLANVIILLEQYHVFKHIGHKNTLSMIKEVVETAHGPYYRDCEQILLSIAQQLKII